MFGRLSQLAQNVQNSFNADEGEGSPSRGADTSERRIAMLQADLEQAEERNKSVNAAFKKLLKEKEQEIKRLKSEATGDVTQESTETRDEKISNPDNELLNQMKRKNEEYQMLIEQKDETIQMLMANVREAEDLREKVEQQERINTEKLMFELAERIKAHENIQRKLEETRHVMTEKDNAIHNMADQMAAQDELLKAKEDSIKKLKRMAAGSETSEDLIVTLQKAIQEKDSRLSQMAQLIDKLEIEKKLLDAKIDNRDGLETSKDQTIKTLWTEIEQKNAMLQTITSEKDALKLTIEKGEQDLKTKIDAMNEKDTVVDELTVKIRSLEKELNLRHSDIEVSSEGASREIGHLKDQLVELREMLKSKSQTIEMFQKEIEEKDSVHGELRHKMGALHKIIEDKDDELQEMGRSDKKMRLERDEYKDKFETEMSEKNATKEQLDKVGSELSQQLDEEAQKLADLVNKSHQLENENGRLKTDIDNVSMELADCKEVRVGMSIEADKQMEKAKELEKEVEVLNEKLANTAEELGRVRVDLENKKDELETANREIELKVDEIEEQRERFDAELSLLQSTSADEKGTTASLLKEMEGVRRELDTASRERDHFERESHGLQVKLEQREKSLEEVQTGMEMLKADKSQLKELVGQLESRVQELVEVERMNETLKADVVNERECLAKEKQILSELQKELDSVKKDLEEGKFALDKGEDSLQVLQKENHDLRNMANGLEGKIQALSEEKESMAIAKVEVVNEKEKLYTQLDAMKDEYLELSGKIKEMESSMNHMVEKLNSAELKMNESMNEKDALEEKLRHTLEERSALASQKSDIEIALEEFVKSTESRKKRSGRSSVDGSEGATSTPNDGLSGYSTPVSKEGSPRNSAFLETLPPPSQAPSAVGNLLEGKAISEIFRLVEEERKALEAKLASVIKEREALSVRNSELEDYLDLEKQKFKQASDEISYMQQSRQLVEEEMSHHISTLEQELSSSRGTVNELELRIQQEEEAAESNALDIQRIETELHQSQEKLADKALELTRIAESSERLQSELGSKEEQLEKSAKQCKQMKVKLKELLKDRAEKEKSMSEKDARIVELDGLAAKLDESTNKIDRLDAEIKEKAGKIDALEVDREEKAVELANVGAKVLQLEEDASKLRELSASEVYSANEKTAELERSFREVEDVNSLLKGEVGGKAREIEDLQSILSVQKEELESVKNLLLQKDEELIVTKNDVGVGEKRISELMEELGKTNDVCETAKDDLCDAKALLLEKENAVHLLDEEIAETKAKLLEATKEVESQTLQSSRQLEYVSKLEDDISEITSEMAEARQKLLDAEETGKAKDDKAGVLEQEIAMLRISIAENEERHGKVVAENERQHLNSQGELEMKEKDIERLIHEKESEKSKVKDLEEMLLSKDAGLREIVDAKNNDLEMLSDARQTLNLELADARRNASDYQQKLATTESDLENAVLKFGEAESRMMEVVTEKDAVLASKAEEIIKLTKECTEKILLVENIQRQLSSVEESMKDVSERKEANQKELDEKNAQCQLLEKTVNDLTEEKFNLSNELESKNFEVEGLSKQVGAASKSIEKLTGELGRQKVALEEYQTIVEQSKDESGSQIERLTSKIQELFKEADEYARVIDSLKTDLEFRSNDLVSLEEKLTALTTERDDLKRDLAAACGQLQENVEALNNTSKELDESIRKEKNYANEIEIMQKQKEQFAEDMQWKEARILNVEKEKAESILNLNEEVTSRDQVITTLRNELDGFHERVQSLEEMNKDLDRSIAGKDEELKTVNEGLLNVGALKKELEVMNLGREQLMAENAQVSAKCDDLEREIEKLSREAERCEKEFEAERDMFAAKISELRTEMDGISLKESESRAECDRMMVEVDRVNAETRSKDELIALKSEELQLSKSMTEKLENEELVKWQEAVDEKSKHFEEYKVKVIKKMKAMKEEIKKLLTRVEELTEKEKKLLEVESDLERQKAEKQDLETVLMEIKSELEVVKDEKQAMLAQIESHKHKIIEIENLNVSREENIRNLETEMVRYQRLLQDKDEELREVKEMMQASMEEVQKLQDGLHKKEEKVGILQEQLMANEEDFSTSFTEKESQIEDLTGKLQQLEAEKDSRISELGSSLKTFEDKIVKLEDTNQHLSTELEAERELHKSVLERNSQLSQKVESLTMEVGNIVAEKGIADNEFGRVMESLAVRENDLSSSEKEIERLKGEVQRMSEEHAEKKTRSIDQVSLEEYEALSNEKEDLLRRIDALIDENQAVSLDSKEKTSEIELLTEQLEQKVTEVERLKSKSDVSFDDVLKPYVDQISELQEDAEKKKRTVEEFKAKASRKIKTLKEENTMLQNAAKELKSELEENEIRAKEQLLGVEGENESLRIKLGEMEEVVNGSVQEVELAQSKAHANEMEAGKMRSELGRVKQRLSDKDEEVLTVKEMMQMSMGDMQVLQDELRTREAELMKVKTSEDALNSSVLSLSEELSSVKDDNDAKIAELTAMQGQLVESERHNDLLVGKLDAQSTELDELKSSSLQGEAEREGSVERKDDRFAEMERESDGLKLKLAKAIKKLGTMKKELQSKDDHVKKLEEDVDSLKSSAANLKDQKSELEAELSQAKQKLIFDAEELQRKEDALKELGNRPSIEPVVSEVIRPTSVIGVAAESGEGWADVSSVDEADGVADGVAVSANTVVFEGAGRPLQDSSLQRAAAEDSQSESILGEMDALRKENGELSGKVKKISEQFDKAKRKIALLKKAEIKRGNEFEELKKQRDELTASRDAEALDLERKIVDLDQIVSEKEEQMSSLVERKSTLKIELDEALRVSGKLRTKNEDLKRLVEVMVEEKHELDGEMKDMLSEIKDVMDIKSKLLADLKEAETAVSMKEVECAGLVESLGVRERELAAMEWKLQEFESREQELEEVKRENFRTEEELATQFSKIHDLENSLRRKETEICSLSEEMLKLKHECSEKEKAVSDLQTEVSRKEDILQESPGQELMDELNERILSLEKDLTGSQVEVQGLRHANEELGNQMKEEKVANENLVEEQISLRNELESHRTRAKALDSNLSGAEEKLRQTLYQVEEMKTRENLNESLQQELNERRALIDKLEKEIAAKNEAFETLSVSFQEAEGDLQKRLDEEASARSYLEEEVKGMRKTIDESFNESERSILNSAIEELRLNSSKQEESLLEEIRLLREKLDKEHEIMNDKSKVEHAELVKSFEEKTHSLGEVEAKVGKLNETLEHKDTVIAKLKLKLKQTMKDRDVMKGNLQSEIERLSQEKDVVFNEFQAKVQQTEAEILKLKTEFVEVEAQNNQLMGDCTAGEKALVERKEQLRELAKELEQSRGERDEISSRVHSLNGKVSALEKEVEAKEEIIEKYEWEASEKEDKVRDLEREARFFDDRRSEWDELKRTFEDTIEVKERIMENLQKEIEEMQARKFKESRENEDNLEQRERRSGELELQLRMMEEKVLRTEEQLKLSNERKFEFEEEQGNVLRLLGISTEDAVNGSDFYDAVLQFKEASDESIQSKKEKICELENDKESMENGRRDLERELASIKEEVNEEVENVVLQFGDEYDSLQERSLNNVLSWLLSERDKWMRCHKNLSDANTNLETQLEELSTRLNEGVGKFEEEKAEFKEEKERGFEEKLASMSDRIVMSEAQQREMEERCKNYDDEVSHLKQELEKKFQSIDQLNHQHAAREKQLSEVEHALDLAKLEIQQVTIDKDSVERQMEIMMQEAESLKSSTLPEMQALISAKNTAMLELRNNFSDVISDKDSIISTMRAKIGELQQNLSEGNFSSQEVVDSLKRMLTSKDDDVATLARDLANVKRSRDWLQTELSKTIKEKNSIGGSIQNQFESISKGLRGDIELFMEDKKAFEAEFQLERLHLERTIAEQRGTLEALQKDMNSKDNEIYELNFVIGELRRRVEDAADILSKEDYYNQLEERLEESHEKIKDGHAALREMQGRLRDEKSKIEDLEVKLEVSNRERGEVVLVYEGKMQKLLNDHAKVNQSRKSELQELGRQKDEMERVFENRIGEMVLNNKFAEERTKEEFAKERKELGSKLEDLSGHVDRLETEKQQAKEQAISEVLTNADEKMLRLKQDYESIIKDKSSRIEAFSERTGQMEGRISSLTESNINLSKNLFALDNENTTLKKDVVSLSNIYQQSVGNHKREIESLLVRKGKEFKELRTQFEEALEEKEGILGNLREKLGDLRERIEVRYTEKDELVNEKEELVQRNIKKELMYERLKVNVESLLNAVFELSEKRGDARRQGPVPSEKTDEEKGSQTDGIEETEEIGREEKMEKDGLAKGFESVVNEAKNIVDDIVQRMECSDDGKRWFNGDAKKRSAEIMDDGKGNASVSERSLMQLESEVESLTSTIRSLEEENAKLHTRVGLFDAKVTASDGEGQDKSEINSNVEEGNKRTHDSEMDGFTGAVEDAIMPTSRVELTAAREDEPQSELLTSMKEEISMLKAENSQLENTRTQIELNVRNDFDDILQNLREDLQNAMNDNRKLMEENFLLKNVKSSDAKSDEEELQKRDVTSQTSNQEPIDPPVALDVKSHTAERGSSLEAFAQTDVSFVYQPPDDPKRDSNPSEAARIQRYSSSDRLPEVVEDTLYSKMAFEQLQTFSDSALDGESFSGHAKLELRLGEDAEDGDKSVNVADLQVEVEGLNSKLQQSKKMIVKMKQMTKKYKAELSELQAEKFEQVRIYEDAINATKQELEECSLEKVRKDQEIRGLREEVRLLVKEKSDLGEAVKSRIDAVIADHSKQAADLASKSDQEIAKKDEVISMLRSMKSENENDIKHLNNELSRLRDEKSSTEAQSVEIQSKLDDQQKNLLEMTKELEELRCRHDEAELILIRTREEKSRLEEKLKVDRKDVMVENAHFDEVIIGNYAEELERTNMELKEAFDLIRAMESNNEAVEEELEMRTGELSSIVDAHEETIARLSSEKKEIEKSMQEMREEVQCTVEEKNRIVEHWKNESEKLVADKEAKFKERINMSQSSIEELQAEIVSLRRQVDLQNTETDDLQKSLSVAETAAKDMMEERGSYDASLENVSRDLEHALRERSLLQEQLLLFEGQIDGMKAEREMETRRNEADAASASEVLEALRMAVVEKEHAVSALETEVGSLKEQVNKGKKKAKIYKREVEASKRIGQELANGIRVEMEKVLSEVQEEKAALYADVLSKDSQLQEIRIHADQLVQEREQWNAKIRTSGPVQSELLVGSGDVELGFTETERLSMQVNQLKAEKDLVVAHLENKIVQNTNDYYDLDKKKRECDLKLAELQAKCEHLQKVSSAKEKSSHQHKLTAYDAEVKGLKGDIETLKQEASGFAGESRMLLGHVKDELTSMLTNAAAKGHLSLIPKAASGAESTDPLGLSPDERPSCNNGELEEAKERIAMLEDSLNTWRERCTELEAHIDQRDIVSEVSARRGSQEFLIDIDDEGPSIESARPQFGDKARRLMKYSTSGISLKSRARSFFSSFMSKQRGMLPVRRIVLMAYIVAVHVLACMALYGLMH